MGSIFRSGRGRILVRCVVMWHEASGARSSGRAAAWAAAVAGLIASTAMFGQAPPVGEAEAPLPPSGASLATDPDVDSLLTRAEQYAGDEQYREALLLLQYVMDHHPTTLSTADGRVYVPASRRVERMIRSLPAEGRELYRLRADGEARGLLGGDARRSRDRAALATVVQRYFMSSLGDDAAYLLGCLELDRGRLHRARGLFERVLSEHPDPDVPRAEVRLRLAVIAARRGDRAAAAAIFDRLAAEGAVAATRLARVRRGLREAADGGGSAERPSDGSVSWPMRFGGPRRDGLMPAMSAPPTGGGRAIWPMLWQESLPPPPPDAAWAGHVTYVGEGQRPQSRPHLVRRWREHGWLPVNRVVFSEGLVYHKSDDRLICRDARTGAVIWRRDPPPRQGGGAYSITHYGPTNLPAIPVTAEEIAFFGDRISAQVAMIGDQVYHIAAHERSSWPTAEQQAQLRQRRGTVVVAGNVLEAVDARTGRTRWRRGRSADPSDPLRSVRFLTPPVAVDAAGRRLLTVYEKQSELFLATLDAETGGLVEDPAFICGYASHPAPPWQPVALAAADDEVYVAPGFGLVVAMSASEGRVLWARRYAPSETENEPDPHGRRGAIDQPMARAAGWEEPAIFPRGDTLVVAPWDRADLLLLNRRTGAAAGPHGSAVSIEGGRYCIGVDESAVLVAEQQGVSAYRLDTGERAWHAPLPLQTGRAAMTESTIYVPCGPTLIGLDRRADGRRVLKAEAVRPLDDPLGNLYSDGERLLVLGMERVYALTDFERQRRRLDARLADASDPVARLERAALLDQVGEAEAALADYRAALVSASDLRIRLRARLELMERLLTRAERRPAEAGPLLRELERLTSTTSESRRVQLVRARHLAAVGRPHEAASRLQSLLDATMPAPGDEMVRRSDELGSLRVSLRATAAATLARLDSVGDEASPGGAELALGPLIEQVDQLGLADDEPPETWVDWAASLVRLIETYPGTPAATRAIEQLAAHGRHVGPARTEAWLKRFERSDRSAVAASAAAARAMFYERIGWPERARQQWRRLLERHGAVSLNWHGQPTTGAALAARRLTDRAEDAAERPDPPPSKGTPPPPWHKKWELRGYGNQLVRFSNRDASPFLRRHMFILLGQRGVLECRPARELNARRAPVWRIPLGSGAVGRYGRRAEGELPNAEAADHVLVTVDAEQLTARSLIDGRELWSTPLDLPPETPNHRFVRSTSRYGGGADLGVSDLAAGAAVVAHRSVTAERIDRVQVHDLAGGDLLWERTFPRATVDGLRIAGGAVCLVLDGGRRLVTCDARTGRMLGETDLPTTRRPRGLAWSQSHLLVDADRTVRCFALPVAEPRWSADYQGGRRFGALDDRTAFLVDRAGNLDLHELATGEVRLTVTEAELGIRLGGNPQTVATGRDGSRLYCVGHDDRGNQMLSVIDAGSGKRIGRVRFSRVYHFDVPAGIVAEYGELIPWIVRRETEGGGWSGHEIAFFDLKTGEERAGLALPGEPGEHRYYQGPPRVVGDTLVVTDHRGMRAFAAREAEPAGERDATGAGDEATNARPGPNIKDSASVPRKDPRQQARE